jgi:N-acyl amino acid synthase FeeM
MGVSTVVFPSTFNASASDLLELVDYRRAESADERDAVFRLRYDCYLKEGAIEANRTRRLTDKYDDSAWVFGLVIDGRLVSAIRISVATRDRPALPALETYPDHLMPLLEAGMTIVEPSRFVVDQASARKYPKLAYLTARLGWLAGEYFNAGLILAACRLEHQAFYKRTYGYRPVCGLRPYLMLTKPLSLMVLDYYRQKEDVHRRYPFFRSTVFERRMLFERPAEAARRAASAAA